MSRFERRRSNGQVFVIAEAGSNHMGSLDDAIRLCRVSNDIGADACKFQLFKPEDILIDPSACDPRTVMPVDWVGVLADECNRLGIDFMCTPFALWSVRTLDPYVRTWKVGSFEYARRDMLAPLEESAKPIIASCGRGFPDIDHPDISYLYCISKYPADPADMHIPFFGETYQGLSDHTTSETIPALAVARGARIIEKHLRLNDTHEDSPDYPHSLSPEPFYRMVKAIREAEIACSPSPETPEAPLPLPNRRQ